MHKEISYDEFYMLCKSAFIFEGSKQPYRETTGSPTMSDLNLLFKSVNASPDEREVLDEVLNQSDWRLTNA